MFGVGWAEVLVVLVVALVVLGPARLPEAARTLGKIYGTVGRAMNEARQALRAEAARAELEKSEKKPPDTSGSH